MAHNLENVVGEPTAAETLVLFKACRARIAVAGQSYQIGSRIYTAADLDKVNKTIRELQAEVNAESGVSQVNYARRMRPA